MTRERDMSMDQIVEGCSEVECDVLVIGGGTAGPMAALKAKLKNPKATVILLEKANVKRSGAICMGMDGLNNAVVPGHATPEQYTKEITIANDGIVNRKAVLKYAQRARAYLQGRGRAKVEPHCCGRAPRGGVGLVHGFACTRPNAPYRRVEKPWVSALSALWCCSM
jgi:choline dehydrogenase-like flavoprotein